VEPILQSSDENFRPVDAEVGADGALYVADWYDPIVGGHQMHDGKGYGRIYRIAPKGRPLATPPIDLGTTRGQIEALLSPAVNVRHSGFVQLRAQGEKSVPAARNLLSDRNPFLRARAVWLLAQLGPAGVQEVESLLADADPQIRIAAFRALRQARAEVLDEARRLAGDPSPAVRREAALALRGIPFERSRDILVRLASGFDGIDRWYLEALGTAATGNEAAVHAALLPALGHRDPRGWDARFSAIAWRLHAPEAIEAFKVRAGSPDLSAAARKQALVALGFVTDPRAAQAMADLTESALRDVSTQAAWWMAYRTRNEWRGYAVERWQTDVPDARPAPRDEMRAHRALVLDGVAPIERRIEAVLAMASDAAGGHLLLQLAAQNQVAYQLREAIGSAIFSNPDRAVRSIAAGYFQRPGGPSQMTIADVTARAGDVGRGESRFLTACATCHRRGDAGADVGPDLTDIQKKFDRAGLVDAIVNPSAAIAFGFGAELFVTGTDDHHIGFVQADGATISIRDGYGRQIAFDRRDLAARVPLAPSLMPDPLALALTEQDVADIAAFLLRVP
jgi:putative heme-binding domain-containing protein